MVFKVPFSPHYSTCGPAEAIRGGLLEEMRRKTQKLLVLYNAACLYEQTLFFKVRFTTTAEKVLLDLSYLVALWL